MRAMRKTPATAASIFAVFATLTTSACSKDESAPVPSPSASAAVTPSASAPPPPVSAPPAPSAAPEPPHDCPTGSTGPGSFTKPCDASGNARMMDVKWKKTDDKGPSFAITNKSKLVIVYGKIAVYFYDKGGKQLDVLDDSTPPKPRRYHTCAGKFFGGPMNPAEKAVLTFSCVPKSVVPDGTATVEAEMSMVGYGDSTGKKIDFYWRNNDLAPDARPKGGVK
jgi:hypothetical protein